VARQDAAEKSIEAERLPGSIAVSGGDDRDAWRDRGGEPGVEERLEVVGVNDVGATVAQHAGEVDDEARREALRRGEERADVDAAGLDAFPERAVGLVVTLKDDDGGGEARRIEALDEAGEEHLLATGLEAADDLDDAERGRGRLRASRATGRTGERRGCAHDALAKEFFTSRRRSRDARGATRSTDGTKAIAPAAVSTRSIARPG
jgi:hypothetical protein